MFKKILLLFLLHSCLLFSQSKIQQSKKDLNQNSASPARVSANSRSVSRNNATLGNSIFEDVLGFVFVGVFKYVIIGSPRFENHLTNELTDFPYNKSNAGNYFSITSVDKNYSGKNYRFDLENHFLMSNKTLYGNHFKAKIRPFQYLYLQADAHLLFEKNQLFNRTEQLFLYGFNAGFDRFRFEKFNFGFTIGANYVGNDVKKAGVSFGLASEAFLGSKISLLSNARWGTINSQIVDCYEFRGRYHISKAFVALGFEHLQIGSSNYNFATFGGGIYLN